MNSDLNAMAREFLSKISNACDEFEKAMNEKDEKCEIDAFFEVGSKYKIKIVYFATAQMQAYKIESGETHQTILLFPVKSYKDGDRIVLRLSETNKDYVFKKLTSYGSISHVEFIASMPTLKEPEPLTPEAHVIRFRTSHDGKIIDAVIEYGYFPDEYIVAEITKYDKTEGIIKCKTKDYEYTFARTTLLSSCKKWILIEKRGRPDLR